MGKRPKKKKKQTREVYCNPDICDNCIYIGEGDSVCDVTHKIVLSDWVPTDDFMGKGCVHISKKRRPI